MEEIKIVRTNIELPDDTWEWVKKEAIRKQMKTGVRGTMVGVIKDAISFYRQKKERN